jgi:hypothetical protein
LPAAIFNGTSVKILKDALKFKSGNIISYNNSADPSSVATAGNPGDLYIMTSGEVFRKTDSGATTNWNQSIDDASLATELANYILLSEKGAANGVATLDAGGKVPASQLPNSIMEYQGTWDASTNTPTLADGTGSAGDVYIVDVAGTQDLGSGNITFSVGDWVVYNGTIWQQAANANSVVSVNGFTGVVSLTTTDIPEGVELYFTDSRAQAAITGAASSVTTSNLSANRVLQSDGSGKISASTISDTILGYLSAVTSDVQNQINNKEASITTLPVSKGGTGSSTALNGNRVMQSSGSTIVEAAAITANKALVSNASGIPVASATTDTELGYVSGVTSAIQTQFTNKQPLDSTLTSLAAYNTNGLLTQTAADTFTGRTLTAGSTKVTITDGNGVAGNPTVDVAEANLNVANMTGTLAILHGGTGQTTQTAAYNALSPLTTKGDIVVHNGTDNVRLAAGANGKVLTAYSGATEGVYYERHSINYITNPGAEVDVVGWAAYADAAQSTPVDGTGGSPTVTITRTTSSPLRGSGSFLITKDAANRQGQGVSFDLTLDSADTTKVMSISMDYTIASGTYSPGTSTTDSDVVCYIYDVTNSALIQPTPFKLDGAVVGQSYTFRATFQATTSTSYRLIFHCATTSASAYTIKYDNVVVGPQVSSFAASNNDWVSYTPSTQGFGTPTSANYFWRRDGDSAQFMISFTSGTTTATEARINLPSGIVFDSNLPAALSIGSIASNESANFNYQLIAEPSGTYFTFARMTTAGAWPTKMNGNGMLTTGSKISVTTVPVKIAGWSSSLQVSDQADGRVVAAHANGTPATATTGNPIIFPTSAFDTHGAYSTSTGRYTVPLAGYYRVTVFVNATNTSESYSIYKNASAGDRIAISQAAGIGAGSNVVSCVAGDILDVRPINAGSGGMGGGGSISFERISGNAVPFAQESVNARYYASATSISGSLATISWTTKDFDSHVGMSSGTYTVPTSGKYQINSAILLSGTFALNNTCVMEIQKNSTVVSRSTEYAGGAITQFKNYISDTISCVAGDTLRIQISSSGTAPAIVSSNFENYMSLERVGN